MMPLDYARRFLSERFALGRSDCATFAAGWAVEALGARPVAVPRLGVRKARSAARRPDRLVRLARHWARRAGLIEASGEARCGDVGIVETGRGLGFAIALGKGQWLVRATIGYAIVCDDPVWMAGR